MSNKQLIEEHIQDGVHAVANIKDELYRILNSLDKIRLLVKADYAALPVNVIKAPEKPSQQLSKEEELLRAFYSVAEVRMILNLSDQAVRSLMKRGIIKSFQFLPGGKILIGKEQIDKIVKERSS